jgi:hypothetical protein
MVGLSAIDADDASEWLRRGPSNFAGAPRWLPTLPTPSISDSKELCFDAPAGCRESTSRAVLVYRREFAFPRTHAIADLLSLAAGDGGVHIHARMCWSPLT